MNKLFLYGIIFLASLIQAQTLQIEKINGNVKILNSKDNTWQALTIKTKIDPNAVISTEKGASVKLQVNNVTFTLKESSAIPVSSIKRMTTDELLLALAMENIINAPRKKDNKSNDNTAVYGSDEMKKEAVNNTDSNMGLKRLNGARQLAESGMEESAIVSAMEIYRKYPVTKTNSEYRIYFTDLLFAKGLYEEAYEEYSDIKSQPLNNVQKNHVDDRIEQIKKKLLNK